MGLYNVQTVNGAIATVEMSDEDAAKAGLGPERRLDAQAEVKPTGKPGSRAGGKATTKARSKPARAPKPVAIPVEEILAANDTAAAAVEVSADEAQDAARS